MVLKNYTKLLIPFSFSNCDINTIDQKTVIKNNKEFNKWIKNDFSTQHLLQNINNKISDNKDAIGKSYLFNSSIRRDYGLPHNPKIPITMISRQKGLDEKFRFNISNVFLILFETNVGFLEFEVNYDIKTYDEYLNINYFLAEIKSDSNIFEYEVSISKNETIHEQFNFKNIIFKLLEDIECIYGFDKNYKLSFCDYKPITFSVLIFDKKPDNIDELIEKGRNNFKDSYKTFQLNNQLKTFENSVWGVSTSGAINISYLVDDEITNNFFLTTFISNTKAQYYYLFLLVLNQRFTLLKRLEQINAIDKKIDVSKKGNVEKAITFVNSLSSKTSLFEVRCNFAVTSTVSHINNVYNLLRKEMQINELINDLDKKIIYLSHLSNTLNNQYNSIINKNNEKIAFIQDIKQTNLSIWILIVTDIIGSINIFATSWGIIEKVTGTVLNQESLLIIFPIFVTAIFFIAILFKLISKYNELKLLKIKYKRFLESVS